MNEKAFAQQRKEHLFIVRIWQEVDQTTTSEWRGYVEHIPTQRRMHFTNFIDLNDFMSWRLSNNSN